MIHEEKDYDMSKIPSDEPVFLLRGTDMFARQVISFWVFLQRKRKGMEAKRESVLAHADRMACYERSHNDTGCTSE